MKNSTRTSKYFAKRTRGFDSKKEEKRWQTLLLEERAGRITQLERQKKFVLIPSQLDNNGKVIERQVAYYADFVYYRDGKLVVEDVKSEYTRKLPEYIIKRKLMLYTQKIKVVEIK